MKKRIGIIGGTFNPIHNGHLLLAEWARTEEKLDEVWFMPAGNPYLKDKNTILPGEDRFRMTQLAINDNPYFKAVDFELIRNGETYTFETLEELNRLYPEYSFYFIVGADCLFTIEYWKETQRIFNNCTLIATGRNNSDWDKMLQKKEDLEERFDANIVLVHIPEFDVSSTMIRERVSKNLSIQYLVPDSVNTFIHEKEFYRG